MLKPDERIIVCAKASDLSLFKGFLANLGYTNLECFSKNADAYEYATRNNAEFFITGLEVDDGPGVVLLQKIRATGNYGLETHLFVGNEIHQAEIGLFYEDDIHYVLKKPFTEDRFKQKLKFIADREANLPPIEAAIKQVHSSVYTKMYDMAEYMLQEAIKEHGSNDRFQTLLGEIALAKEDYTEAEKILTGVLNSDPNSMWANSLYAKLLMATNQKEEAKNILDQLAGSFPNHVNILENAGLTNYELGFIELAEKQMKSLQNIDKSNKKAFEVSTKIKINNGDISSCLKDLQETHSEKEIVSIMNTTGIELAKKGDREGANRVYHETLQVAKNTDYKAKLHYNIALNLHKMNDKEGCATHLQTALKLKPDYDKAATLLKEISRSSVA